MKMRGWPRILGLALLSGGMLISGPAARPQAATSADSDILSNDDPGEAVNVGRLKPLARPNQQASKSLPSGNPLWAVPLSVLTVTRERPIFSTSRRPPPPAVVAAPADPVNRPQPQKAAEPEHLSLALIGAVVGDNDAIAVFLDRSNQKIIRLRQGETHAGWRLSSVQRREVTLQKAARTEVIALQRQDGPVGVSGTPAVLGLVSPVAGGTDASYAPFMPHSVPKNGEPDGL
jgi:general secretion pathway protein N